MDEQSFVLKRSKDKANLESFGRHYVHLLKTALTIIKLFDVVVRYQHKSLALEIFLIYDYIV